MVNEKNNTDKPELTDAQLAAIDLEKKTKSQRRTIENHYNTAVKAQTIHAAYVGELEEGVQPSRNLQAIGWYCDDVIKATQLIEVDGNMVFDANANSDNYANASNQWNSLKPAIENACANYPNFNGLIRTRNASIELTEAQQAVQTSNAAIALKATKAVSKVIALELLAQPRYKKGTKIGVPHDEASMTELIQGLIEKMTPLVPVGVEAQTA